MSLSGEDRVVARAIVESSDPSVKPADRLRALELLADGPDDVVEGSASVVFGRRLAAASDAELVEMVDELLGGVVLEEDRLADERQARALVDADAEADRRARELAASAAERIAAERIMAAREETAAAVARADALELELSEFVGSGRARRPRLQGPPPGIDPAAGWGDGRGGRGGRLGGL